MRELQDEGSDFHGFERENGLNTAQRRAVVAAGIVSIDNLICLGLPLQSLQVFRPLVRTHNSLLYGLHSEAREQLLFDTSYY